MKLNKKKPLDKVYSIRLPAEVKRHLHLLQDEQRLAVSKWLRNVILMAYANLSLTASDPEGWVPDPQAEAYANQNAPKGTDLWRAYYEGYLAGRNVNT
jgi:hypothetical protein